MKLLLDTHVAVWAILDDVRLSAPIQALIGDPANEVSVSVVSVWEIAIKYPLARGGSGEMPVSGLEALNYFREAGYTLLNVTPEHAVAVENLIQVHRDPFDRLLVAQALREPMRLVTHDPRLAAYSDTVILF